MALDTHESPPLTTAQREGLRRLLAGRRVIAVYLNFGPYHLARLRAIAAALDEFDAKLVAVELSRSEKVYPWRVEPESEPFEWRTLVADRPVEQIPPKEQAARVRAVFDEVDPVAAVIPGWSHAFHRAAAGWCRRRRRRVVICGSTHANTRRKGYSQLISRAWYIELYKRWLFRGFSAAVASGDLCRDYFASLGMPRERISLKYDAIDNAFFERLAADTRADLSRWRAQLALPERFFFYPSRLLELKNHDRLFDAYSLYRARTKSPPWGLVILGSGPMEQRIDARIAELALPDVLRRAFAQIDEVARYYGVASCLILPSWSETWGLIVNEAAAASLPVLVSDCCPVATHLVDPGVNGWRFDAFNVEEMAQRMLDLAALSDEERAAMGRASREIVSHWDTKDHAYEVVHALTFPARGETSL